MSKIVSILIVIALLLGSISVVFANRDHCGDLEELKVDPPHNGTYEDGDFRVEVEIRDTDKGEVFDYSANQKVVVVAVKGGPNYNLYDFGDGDPSEDGLHALENDNNGKYYDLSHIIFCYSGEDDDDDCRNGGGDCECDDDDRHDDCDPTKTPTSEPTSTPIHLTLTPTNTAIPPQPTSSNTPEPTFTPIIITITPTPEPTLPPIVTNTPTPTAFPTIVLTPFTPVPSPTFVAPPEQDNLYYLPIIRCQRVNDPCVYQPYS